MGRDIGRDRFTGADFDAFSARLRGCLGALEELLRSPDFGEGAATIGAELELFLVDPAGRPLLANQKVLHEALDPRLTYELDRFEIECNLSPVSLAGRPFEALGREIREVLTSVARAARAHRGRAASVGILPTFLRGDFGSRAMTPVARYRAISSALRERRREPFAIRIDGPEPLETSADDVALEGANASFQVHLRAPPPRFAATYDAAQLAAAPALAVAGNSPTFLGHRLWHETRIALVKQATDDRPSAGRRDAPPARVSFGRQWAGATGAGLFGFLVDRYAPVLPVLSDEDPRAALEAGRVPGLAELRLHVGTVWLWNRPVYDPAGGGHLRVEMRALPSGPTPVDMLANAAFLLGLTLGIAPQAQAWTGGFPFADASRNFYRAAQDGLEARLLWPRAPGGPLASVPAREVALGCLPLARRGLRAAGVEAGDADPLLAVLEARIETGQTGAIWQQHTLAALEPRLGRQGALAEMFQHYLRLADAG
ncbi:MAG: glutamate--cysteine ligase, partial [Thermodesulfobacteriota bacterium]